MSYGERWSVSRVLSTAFEFPTGYLLMAALLCQKPLITIN